MENARLFDLVQRGSIHSCGKCTPRKRRSSKPGPVTPPAPPVSQQAATPPPLIPKHGTPEWYQAAIASKTAAAERLESQAREFEQGIIVGGIEAMGEESNDRKWHRAITAAAKMRAEIARLDKQMRQREVGTKKKVLTTADRIAALAGGDE